MYFLYCFQQFVKELNEKVIVMMPDCICATTNISVVVACQNITHPSAVNIATVKSDTQPEHLLEVKHGILDYIIL